MLMPSPTRPDCGTQKKISRIGRPASESSSRGPGTLVITAVVLAAKRLTTIRCTAAGTTPSSLRMA